MPRGSAKQIRAGGAVFEISLNSAQLLKGINALQTRITAFGSSVTKAFAKASLSVGAFGNALKRVGSFGILGGRGLGGLTGAFAGAGATAALLYPIKLAANIEVASAQLAVFTGGFAKAQSILLDLQKFSAKAFIPPESLAESAALLLKYGVGVNDAVKSTKSLATISAGSSEELSKLSLAFAQVASTGHLTGEEVRQFKNTAFNPLVEIAARTGETFDVLRKRMEAGGISFGEVADALNRAVGPGGRFHGLLEAIAKTATGRFRAAIAQIKIGLIPLGNEVLPAITEQLSRLGELLPSVTKILKENAALYKQLLIGVGVAALLGTAFIALGIALTFVAEVAGVFLAVLGGITAAIAFAVSPLGVLTLALGGLVHLFITATDAGKMMVSQLITAFESLQGRVREMFGGISDALMANDLQLAGRVLFAGLEVAWLEGTMALKQMWDDMLTEIVDRWDKAFNQIVKRLEQIQIVQDLQLTGQQVITDLAKTASSWREVAAEMGAPFAHAAIAAQDALARLRIGFKEGFAGGPESPGGKAVAEELKAHELRIKMAHERVRDAVQTEQALRSTLDQEQAARSRAVGEARAALARAQETEEGTEGPGFFAAEEKRRKAEERLNKAQQAFFDAQLAARRAAEQAKLPGAGLASFAGRIPIPTRVFDQIAQSAGFGAAEEAKKGGARGLATFDIRLIRQMSGAQRVEEQQLEQLRGIFKGMNVLIDVVEANKFSFSTQP